MQKKLFKILCHKGGLCMHGHIYYIFQAVRRARAVNAILAYVYIYIYIFFFLNDKNINDRGIPIIH